MAKNSYQHGELRRARQALGLTQEAVADRIAELAWYRDRRRVGLNADMVAKWERGEKTPIPEYQQLLSMLFDATPAELGLATPGLVTVEPAGTEGSGSDNVPWAEILLALGAPGHLLHRYLIEEWESDLLKRRELLKSMGLAAVASTLAALPPPVAHGAGLADHLLADQDTLQCLGQLAASYQRLYPDTAPQVLMTPIKAHLSTVAELLRQGCAPRERRLLLMNQSQVAMLAGRVAFFDLRDPLAARGYLMLAYDSAVAVGDASLAAGALGHLSFVPADAAQWSAAEDHLGRAVAYAKQGAPTVVQSWLAAVTSEIRTNAGDHRGALAAIDAAKHSDESHSRAAPRWFDFYDRSRLHGFEGYALLRDGSIAGAANVLERALTELAPTAVKQRTVFLTDLATARVQQDNIDEGCTLAARAAGEVRAGRYATCVSRLREFRSSLRPYETSRAVRELDHAMVGL